jgi:hypothetical protein
MRLTTPTISIGELTHAPHRLLVGYDYQRGKQNTPQ